MFFPLSKKIKLLLLFLFTINAFSVFGQSELFEIINNSLNLYESTPKYSMQIQYVMYTHKGNEFKKTEEYTLGLVKDQEVNKVSVFDGEMYTYDNSLLTVFPKEKKLLIRDNTELPFFISSLDYLKTYEKKYDGLIEYENSKEIVVKLSPKAGVDNSDGQIVYEEIKLTISKKNNQLMKQQLFFTKGIDPESIVNKKIEMLTSMMEMSFSDIEIIDVCLPEFSEFLIEDSLGKLKPTPLYTSYTVTDNRKKTNKKI